MSILLTPARIGGLRLKNRIVMPPMTTHTADAVGHVTDATITYYMARVRGGQETRFRAAAPGARRCGRARRLHRITRGCWLHGATIDMDGGEVRAL